MLVTCASAKGGVGKTTSAIHITALLAQNDRTLLIDGDPNHSALKWAKRGVLPFQVVDLMAASRHTRNYEHIVFDTPARPKQDDLEALFDGCDLLIIPTTPDILSIDATLETVDMLNALKCDRYRILLTIIPPSRKTGEQAREALADLPLFEGMDELKIMVREQSEATKRLVGVSERQAATLDRQAATLDRQTESIDRQVQTTDRLARIVETLIQR